MAVIPVCNYTNLICNEKGGRGDLCRLSGNLDLYCFIVDADIRNVCLYVVMVAGLDLHFAKAK